MGPALDHHRHLARRAGARPRPDHGREVTLYLLADCPRACARRPRSAARAPPRQPTHGNVRHGFVYERVPHITLKSIANNAEIDVIYDAHQPKVQAAPTG